MYLAQGLSFIQCWEVLPFLSASRPHAWCNPGVRHSIGGADYASVRAGAFMGLRMMTQQKAEEGPEPLGQSGSFILNSEERYLLKQTCSQNKLKNEQP